MLVLKRENLYLNEYLYYLGMPKLYERNIQQLRGSSFVITLPKEWVLDSGLEKGASVILAVEPYIIRIIPATTRVKRTAKLVANEMSQEMLEEAIKWSYLSGIDELIISQSGGVSNNTRTTIRKLRTVIPGMVISYEDNENVKIEFAELALRDFTDSLKTFLLSIKRTLQEIIEYIENKSEQDSDISISAEECISNSLIISRLSSKSIIQPALNISTISIHGLLAIAITTVDLTELVIDVVDTLKKTNITSIMLADCIKAVVSILDRMVQLTDDFKKESFNSSVKTIIDELGATKSKINSSDLDTRIKIALIDCIETIRKMVNYLRVHYLMTVIYPY